ncbi:MAG: hypothetical protein GY732_18935 [Gammaproteobacteria bacterium]|nr:hypothetical protein [Gammaproteobacteria bacterium]
MKKQNTFFSGLLKRFSSEHDTVKLSAPDKLRLSGKGLRVLLRGQSFAIEMGKQILHIVPDLPLDPDSRSAACDYVIFDPELYYSRIAHALRVSPKGKLVIDHHLEDQKYVFSHPRDAFRRHLQISHEGDALVFRDPISELGTYLRLVEDEGEVPRLLLHRRQSLEKIFRIYGGPLELLPPETALDTLQQVNQLLRDEPYRPQDSFGNTGGVVELPARLTPIVVGDLHAQVDNLLRILCENSFLTALENDEAALILLGDVVHPEAENELDFMDSSALIMDLIFKLKLRFPEQVFFVLGNHDSFSPDVMKAGVPQSLIWERKLTELRGEIYREEMGLFYRNAPLVVMAEDFVACHAGPPRSRLTKDILINVRQYPGLLHELTWNRVKAKGHALGYTRRDVKQFRKSLSLELTTPFIVAHFPQSKDETLWLDVGGIPHHHVLYSARPDKVAIFTRVNGEMIPQIYPSEHLLASINTLGEDSGFL